MDVTVVASAVASDHRLELESPRGTRFLLSDGELAPGGAGSLSTTFAAGGRTYAPSRLADGSRTAPLDSNSLDELEGSLSTGPQPWTLHHRGLSGEWSWTLHLYSLSGGGSSESFGFLRGDCNGDGIVSGIPDGLYVLRYGFLEGPAPPCFDAADTNDDGRVSAIPDALYLLRWFFSGGPPPPDPGPVNCGRDPDSSDALECEMPTPCT